MPLVNSRHAVARWLAAPLILAFLTVPAAAVGTLVGAVMKATRGRADASRVLELILARLTRS